MIGKRIVLPLMAFALLAATDLLGQTDVERSVISSGAAAAVAGGIGMIATLGQSLIGPATGGQQAAFQGFWYGPMDISSGIAGGGTATGTEERMSAAPNPFSKETELRIDLPETSRVTVAVHDMLGRVVRTLVDDVREAGALTLRLAAGGLESGRYTVRMTAGRIRRSLPLIVVK